MRATLRIPLDFPWPKIARARRSLDRRLHFSLNTIQLCVPFFKFFHHRWINGIADRKICPRKETNSARHTQLPRGLDGALLKSLRAQSPLECISNALSSKLISLSDSRMLEQQFDSDRGIILEFCTVFGLLLDGRAAVHHFTL